MLKLEQALLVEGKYDAARLSNIVDGTILTTDGFRVFKDGALQRLLKRIAAAQGLIILTDSDAAGFKIRHFVTGLVGARQLRARSHARPSPARRDCSASRAYPTIGLYRALKPPWQVKLLASRKRPSRAPSRTPICTTGASPARPTAPRTAGCFCAASVCRRG